MRKVVNIYTGATLGFTSESDAKLKRNGYKSNHGFFYRWSDFVLTEVERSLS